MVGLGRAIGVEVEHFDRFVDRLFGHCAAVTASASRSSPSWRRGKLTKWSTCLRRSSTAPRPTH